MRALQRRPRLAGELEIGEVELRREQAEHDPRAAATVDLADDADLVREGAAEDADLRSFFDDARRARRPRRRRRARSRHLARLVRGLHLALDRFALALGVDRLDRALAREERGQRRLVAPLLRRVAIALQAR